MRHLALLLLLAVFGLAAQPLSPAQLESELDDMERVYQPIELLRDRIGHLLQEADVYPMSQQMRIRRLSCWSQSADDMAKSRAAIAYADSQLKWVQKEGDEAAVVDLTLCRGWFHQLMGDVVQARRDYDEGLVRAKRAGLEKLEALALARRGAMLSFHGASGQGLVDLTRAHTIYERLGLISWYQQAQLDIAASFRRMGLYAEAVAALESLRQHFVDSHDSYGTARLSDQLAMIYLQTDRYQDALTELEQSAAYYLRIRYHIEYAERQVMKAEALLGLDRLDEAKVLLDTAAKVLLPDVDPVLHAHIELVLAKWQNRVQQPEQALRSLAIAEPILKAEDHVLFLKTLYGLRSDSLEQLSNYPAALVALREHLVQELRLDQLQREQSTAWVRGEFELARQEAENRRLRAEQQLQQQELARVKERRFWLLVVMVLCGGLALLTMGWLLERNRRMHRLAFTDELTGINNRRRVLQHGSDMFALARRQGTPFCLLVFDIDHFKRINDTLGHHQGDRVLQWVSQAVASQLRQHDVLGRIGGEEFLVLLPDTGIEEACRVAERIRERVANLTLPGLSHPVTISIGVACQQADDPDLAALTRRADEALYRAKEAGRNRVETDD
ncbi:diguanylate cyclase [Aeromonas allosaccharophila]|uniref:GGDEF domain-containing protein n=1 Tax=Aeromonas allosaccharophila TaxID=656 RepID=UPI001F1A5995|nr:tetratricopeptide repeat-containing diguanylate cyclase [Aeromonas allosaccharophila]MCE9847025.1 diguanylate cyclase [Aeromonas allosaccharophila]